jgi:hypothetical protein
MEVLGTQEAEQFTGPVGLDTGCTAPDAGASVSSLNSLRSNTVVRACRVAATLRTFSGFFRLRHDLDVRVQARDGFHQRA